MNVSLGILKQYMFDCAVELIHESEGLSREEIAGRLLWVIAQMDKLESENNDVEESNITLE